MRFVHADVDVPAAEILRAERKEPVQKLIGALFADEQNVVRVVAAGVLVPTENPRQVRQRLDTGNEFHSPFRGVGVQLADLLGGVSAPQVTEIGLLRDGVHVLRIQLQGGIAHFGDLVHKLFEGGKAVHRPPRTIQHHAEIG